MTIKLDLKNKLINGMFEYWQRGTSFAAIANNTYFADRWGYGKSGSVVHTALRSTDVPSDAFSDYSASLDLTTALVSPGASDVAFIYQHIEGNFFRPLKGKKCVLKFKVKATKTGISCVSLRSGSASRCLIKEFTINQTETWETKTIRFQHDPSGAWLYDNGSGMIVSFPLVAGSNNHGIPDIWQNGVLRATANQVNHCDNIANVFQITDVCLVEDNEGQTREPEFQLAGRDIFEELELCQRYYEKSYNIDVAPASNTNDGIHFHRKYTAAVPSSSFNFRVTKRATPLMSFWTPNGTSGWTSFGTLTPFPGMSGCAVLGTNAVDSGNGTGGHWAADAEL